MDQQATRQIKVYKRQKSPEDKRLYIVSWYVNSKNYLQL
jgi:hypothetical protein